MTSPAREGHVECRRGGWMIAALAVIAFAAPAVAQDGFVVGPQEIPGDTRVTLSAKEQPLSEVINYLRERSGVNIILADGIEEQVTVDLQRVPWRLALEIVAEKAGCVLVEKASNLIRVEQPPRVTFNFTGADIKTVIDAIAKYAGASIVVAPDVEGTVHLRLNDVPWRTALETIVKSLGFVVVEESWGIYRVVHPATLETQMVTRVFPVKYLRPPPPFLPRLKSEYAERLIDPKQMGRGTGGGGGGAGAGGVGEVPFTLITALRNTLTAKGKLDYYSQNNLIVVKDIPPVITEIERMLNEIDVEPGQVFIDVKFVTTTNTDALSYGVDPGEQGFTVGLTGGAIPSRLPFNLGTGGWNNEIIAADPAYTPGLDDQGLRDAIVFGTLDFTKATFTLNLLARDETSRLVQAPKLLALDNQEATIFVGRTVRYAETVAESNQSGGLTYSIREATNSPVQTGFQLYLVPHIVPGTNKIIMTIIPQAESLVGRSTDPNFSGFQIFTSGEGTPNEVSIALPQVASQTMVSTLMLESGETAVIGGLITETDTERTNKIPVLGDLPILGFLFKSVREATFTESLMIFLTPRIIRDTESYDAILEAENRKRQEAIQAEMRDIFESGVGAGR